MAAALLQAKEKERMCEPQDTSQAPRERCQGFEALNPGACSQKEKKKSSEIRVARSHTAALNRKSESAHQEDRFVTSFLE